MIYIQAISSIEFQVPNKIVTLHMQKYMTNVLCVGSVNPTTYLRNHPIQVKFLTKPREQCKPQWNHTFYQSGATPGLALVSRNEQ